MAIAKYYKTYFSPYNEMAFHLWQVPDTLAVCRRNNLWIIDSSRSSLFLGTVEEWSSHMLKKEAA